MASGTIVKGYWEWFEREVHARSERRSEIHPERRRPGPELSLGSTRVTALPRASGPPKHFHDGPEALKLDHTRETPERELEV